MLIKLHGTSGSGKTTVARGLISKASENILRNDFHELRIPTLAQPLFILGRYDKVKCGGMDTIQSPERQIELMETCAKEGHVFYEGLLLSGFYGRIGQASEKFGDQHVFGFLTTPLETCLERVQARRAERGTTTAFNPANTEDKFDAILRLKWRLDNELNRRTSWVSWKKPVDVVMELYHASES
jgi:hypothetical protein